MWVAVETFAFITLTWLIAKSLSHYLVWVFDNAKPGKRLAVVEQLGFEVLCPQSSSQAMTCKRYALNLLSFNILGFIVLYTLLVLQHRLTPGSATIPWPLAANIAVSYITNTNWQSFIPELAITPFNQSFGLVVQNFFSAATGMCVAVAFVRGLTQANTGHIGNVWHDLIRCLGLVLMPCALIMSLGLVSVGVLQTTHQLEPSRLLSEVHQKAATHPYQIPLGQVASQVAIKQLGTNGGGYFNANSAHPFENPNKLSYFLQLGAMLIFPLALLMSFGQWAQDKGQARSLLLLCLVILTLSFIALSRFEHATVFNAGQGQELRFTTHQSLLWSLTSALSGTGSFNADLGQLSSMSHFLLLTLMQCGGVIIGSVGMGLVNLLMMVMLAIFMVGLLTGKLPEYLGNKIRAIEMTYISLALISPAILVLSSTALTVSALSKLYHFDVSPTFITEILAATTATASNTGLGLIALTYDSPGFQAMLSVLMLLGRYIPILLAFGLCHQMSLQTNNLQRKSLVNLSGPLFSIWLCIVIFISASVIYIPMLCLGPLAQVLAQG